MRVIEVTLFSLSFFLLFAVDDHHFPHFVSLVSFYSSCDDKIQNTHFKDILCHCGHCSLCPLFFSLWYLWMKKATNDTTFRTNEHTKHMKKQSFLLLLSYDSFCLLSLFLLVFIHLFQFNCQSSSSLRETHPESPLESCSSSWILLGYCFILFLSSYFSCHCPSFRISLSVLLQVFVCFQCRRTMTTTTTIIYYLLTITITCDYYDDND